MSLEDESPAPSSSSDDFAAILEGDLQSDSSDPSPDLHDHSEVEDVELDRTKRQKLYDSEEEEDAQQPVSLQPVAEELKECPPHPGFIKRMCIRCGQEEDSDTGTAFGYIHKDLRLGTEEIARLRDADIKDLLSKRKLHLILDLDHTLLNSTRLVDVSPEEGSYLTETYLKHQADSLQGEQTLFKLDKMNMFTKLRPYVHKFLREASTMFEMHVYTMGERAYAFEMVKLLDPNNVYFTGKVISQDDCTQRHQKGLDVVLGDETAVVILDDTEMVWQKHQENLILMERYHFFASSSRHHGFTGRSLTELMQDESESDGILATILQILKRVHGMFFDSNLSVTHMDRDVRKVLKVVRHEILKGCQIVFSGLFPVKCEPHTNPLWRMAENLGATCSTEIDSSVTHIVTVDLGTEKSRWGLQQNRFVVNPGWLEASNYLWKRQTEARFPVKVNAKNKTEASSSLCQNPNQ